VNNSFEGEIPKICAIVVDMHNKGLRKVFMIFGIYSYTFMKNEERIKITISGMAIMAMFFRSSFTY